MTNTKPLPVQIISSQNSDESSIAFALRIAFEQGASIGLNDGDLCTDLMVNAISSSNQNPASALAAAAELNRNIRAHQANDELTRINQEQIKIEQERKARFERSLPKPTYLC